MFTKFRVRFAPSPTGFMHLGNIRAALFNFIFARQKNGTLVLRIEDTDQERNVDEAGKKIIDDLKWLKIGIDEGPFLQSDRTHVYQEQLDDLVSQQRVYRCFCTPENLEKKRKEQIALGKPPRYDRTCLHLSDDHIKQKLVAGMPFVWRFQVNHDQVVTVKSMVRDELKFELKNFTDFILSRSDGSFTFLFTNFVDDWLMEITHVIRGEDHLSNTAMQAALYDALAVPTPTFWHLPIICNKEGKKLSKRDFGFALGDLKEEGFLPEAICNYLAIIGVSFKDEIKSVDELIRDFDFDHMHSTGSIKYDVEKLRWINHKWIERLDIKDLLPSIAPFLKDIVREKVSEDRLLYLIEKVKTDCHVLKDFADNLRFCFVDPECDHSQIEENVKVLIKEVKVDLPNKDLFMETLKRKGKESGIKPKDFMTSLRYLLTGSFKGLGVHDVLDMLDDETIDRRLGNF